MTRCSVRFRHPPVPAGAQTVDLIDDGTVLKQIIVFGRHGVRSPTVSPADYAKLSPRPNPDFGVPPGYLTAHGWQAETLLGAYYRAYLLHEQLLTGDATWDASRSYFRANSIQRSNVTADAFGAGLLEGMTVPVHSYPLGQPDPAFDPISAKVAAVDAARGRRGSSTGLQQWSSVGISIQRRVFSHPKRAIRLSDRR